MPFPSGGENARIGQEVRIDSEHGDGLRHHQNRNHDASDANTPSSGRAAGHSAHPCSGRSAGGTRRTP
jgi:hypothetical protein